MTTDPAPNTTESAMTLRGAFLQVIEFHTDRPGHVAAAVDDFTATMGGDSKVLRCAMATDRDHPGHHLLLVEFDSYESAMQNSAHPVTAAFAHALGQLATDVVYRNWDRTYA